MGTLLLSPNSTIRKSWADIIEEEERELSRTEEIFELIDKSSRDGFNLEFKDAFSLNQLDNDNGKGSKRSSSDPWNLRPSKIAKITDSPLLPSTVIEVPQESINSKEGLEEIKQIEQNMKDQTSEEEGEMKEIKEEQDSNEEHVEIETSTTRSFERESYLPRLQQREKQIRIGKNTEAYRRYQEQALSKKKRSKTPDKYQICSKRSWDGQVSKWRRMLHKYDKPKTESTE